MSKTSLSLEIKENQLKRQRRKAEDTREEILKAAEQQFRECGIGASSIAHIAKALDMSPANVFKHFHSKTALADAICERHITQMISQLDSMTTTAPAPKRLGIVARRLMDAHLRNIADTPYLFEMIFMTSERDFPSARRYGELIERLLLDIIMDGVRAGIYTSRDPHRSSRAVAAAFGSIFHPVFLVRESADELGKRCDELVELVNAALQNPLVT
jgi:TetR/AcrR family transcriptional repressor of the ameABC operon